jgi:hypothetical protein
VHPKRIVLGIMAMLALAGSGSAAPAPATPASQSLGLLAREIFLYAGPLGPFRAGIWTTTSTACWACNQGGPATAAATVYMLAAQPNQAALQAAEATIDTAIATRQQPSGAFVGPAGDGQSPDVATMFFGVEEGNAYLELAPALDAARKARWQASLAAAANFLIRNGNLTWYTNGNINLGNDELMYLAWLATGNPAFKTAFEQGLAFTLAPPQTTWPGRGLIVAKAPTRADGSDGSGYLSETGVGGTGFDPEYTELQLDIAARMYLLSGDPRLERLANLFVNALLPRIDSSYMLDTSGGTRHPTPGRKVPLITSAFAVLGLDGGRADLVPRILPQLSELQATYAESWNDYGDVYRRAIGNDVSVIALATDVARALGWGTNGALAGPSVTAPGAAPPPGPVAKPPPAAAKPRTAHRRPRRCVARRRGHRRPASRCRK